MHQIEQYDQQERWPRAYCLDCKKGWAATVDTPHLAKTHAQMKVHTVDIITEHITTWGPTND